MNKHNEWEWYRGFRLRERLIHFLFCNKKRAPGCVGHTR